MKPVSVVRSRTVVLAVANVDTDQIIPARFLTTVTRDGLGEKLFADWRAAPDFVLDRPEAHGCEILVTGPNFGCGSSREHAPWALLDFGFRAIVSTKIADIFRINALKNGLLPVIVDEPVAAWLLAHPGAEVAIDVARSALDLPDGRSIRFPLEAFARHCLLNGIDELGYLLQHESAISAYESRLRDVT